MTPFTYQQIEEFHKASTFLIYSRSLRQFYESEFYEYLKEEGFCQWVKHGDYNCGWVFVNIYDKVYAPGMPGVAHGVPVGNHAITISEFKTIYNIFKKYAGKGLYVFNSERFDTEE